MTPEQRDEHNKGQLVHCNGLGRWAGGIDWRPLCRTANGSCYTPDGLKLGPPKEFKAMTHAQLVAHFAETGELVCPHLALAR